MYCRFCGSKIPSGAIYCVGCGQRISDNPGLVILGPEVPAGNINSYINALRAGDPQLSEVLVIEQESRKPWYSSYLGLVFFFLVANFLGILLWFVWKKDNVNIFSKWVLTVICLVFNVLIFLL